MQISLRPGIGAQRSTGNDPDQSWRGFSDRLVRPFRLRSGDQGQVVNLVPLVWGADMKAGVVGRQARRCVDPSRADLSPFIREVPPELNGQPNLKQRPLIRPYIKP